MKYLVSLALAFVLFLTAVSFAQAEQSSWWQIQSIDTMKYSRDMASQVLNDPEGFATVIDSQMNVIAATGATHVAIGTPYDEEFIPALTLWVNSARAHGLHVWFRGNFAGWEGWFNYPKIDREQHKQLLVQFIQNHPDLFKNGDLFSACPECENGGPGDPRMNGDIIGHRQFLIAEYQLTQQLFRTINKNVQSNLPSMNADVARDIMDPETTSALGGVVVIDHYVNSPEQLARDVSEIAKNSGGDVVLGELGAPIPDIHGKMTESQQSAWIDDTLARLSLDKSVIGINYWVNKGGSTALWNDDDTARAAVKTLTSYFIPPHVEGVMVNELNQPMANATIKTPYKITHTDSTGHFYLALSREDKEFSAFKDGYIGQTLTVPTGKTPVTIYGKRNVGSDPVSQFLYGIYLSVGHVLLRVFHTL